jgi:S-adenosyl methyltransferase
MSQTFCVRRESSVDPAAVPPRPVLDSGRITRLRDVLAGGYLALEPDRRLAASIRERWPRTADLVRDANDFHRRAAEWAVRGGTPGFPVSPAAGVIFAACGYPLPGGFHAAAQAARPDALFAYADPDPAAIMYNLARLHSPDPGHVSAIPGSARDRAGLLSAGHAVAMMTRGPVMVQLQLCAQWWPAEFCAWAVCEYARLLPPGSTLALSLGVPGGARGTAEFTRDIGRAGGRMYGHTEDDVAGWLKAPDGTMRK